MPNTLHRQTPLAGLVGLLAIVATSVLFVALPGSAAASTAGCFDLTNTNGSSYSQLTVDLDLTRQQAHDVQWRSADYFRGLAFKGWGGLGLTADQIATLNERLVIQAKKLKPLGYPCAAFTHRTKTLAWVRETLVANGFRSASIRVTNAVPRQLQLKGIQDGIDVWIVVARKGAKGITIALTTTHSGGSSSSFTLPFVP